LPRLREEQLHVIIMGGTDEPGQSLAANNNTDHFWCQAADLAHLQQPHFRFVAHAARGAHRCCLERF